MNQVVYDPYNVQLTPEQLRDAQRRLYIERGALGLWHDKTYQEKVASFWETWFQNPVSFAGEMITDPIPATIHDLWPDKETRLMKLTKGMSPIPPGNLDPVFKMFEYKPLKAGTKITIIPTTKRRKKMSKNARIRDLEFEVSNLQEENVALARDINRIGKNGLVKLGDRVKALEVEMFKPHEYTRRPPQESKLEAICRYLGVTLKLQEVQPAKYIVKGPVAQPSRKDRVKRLRDEIEALLAIDKRE